MARALLAFSLLIAVAGSGASRKAQLQLGGHSMNFSTIETTDTTRMWIIIGLAVLALLVIVATAAASRRARVRRARLRERFGPEYDRVVDELGSRTRADRELEARARRVEHMPFRELSEADRVRFTSSWSRIQAQFVDDPAAAVGHANELIKEVMHARGYTSDGFEQRVADLSVDHPDVVQHYRAARALSEPDRSKPVNTEELRQAVVHYRGVFADLLQVPEAPPETWREAHV
jgi:hypothetical protein